MNYLETKLKNEYQDDPLMNRIMNIGHRYMNAYPHVYDDFLLYARDHFAFAAPETVLETMQGFLSRHPQFSANVSAMLMFELSYIQDYGTNALSVREFTQGAFGKCPDRPSEPLTREKAEFITGMVISEMVELMQTVMEPGEDVISVVRGLCDRDYNTAYVKPEDKVSLIAEQADAMTDAVYYLYDTGSRMGVNLDRVFNVVCIANMAKRDPKTGKFLHREDGKILKPEGWKEPDIVAEIKEQMSIGAWEP